MSLKKRSRWTNRLLATWGLAGALGLCGAANLAVAQGPPAPVQDPSDSVNRAYLNKPLIHLPIEIDAAYRTQVNSLVLYVKEGANGTWSQRDKAAPMQTSFTFRAQHDGEYWFRIVAIDNQGRQHPDDLNKDPQDAVVVVVDTAPPTLDIGLHSNTPEGQVVQCDMRDANPDIFKMRFYYQTRDQQWRHLESSIEQPNLYCVPAQAALTNFIRVVAVDLAGNTTARTLNLSELALAPKTRPNPTPPAAQAPVTQSPAPVAQAPVAWPQQIQQVQQQQPAPQPMPQQPQASPLQVCTAPATLPSSFAQQPMSVASQNLMPVPVSSEPVNVNPTGEPRLSHHQQPINQTSHETTAGTLARQTPTPNVQLVNSTQVFLNYAVENIGASGVGKMEIYCTSDRGQNWQRVSEDMHRKNPVEVNLPGEGVYGLKLVAANGRGFGAQPPQAGDPADWWVEVDTTKPKVALTGIRPGVGSESGSMHVFWQAEDKNLGTDTAELFVAPSREGPWTLVAKNLKSVGQHRWTPPSDAGAHAFLRLIVRDKAGNVGLSETTQPVPLDDNSRPRIRLLGVTASPAPATSGLGTIQPVQQTNMPVDAGRVQPATYSTSNLGVEVR